MPRRLSGSDSEPARGLPVPPPRGGLVTSAVTGPSRAGTARLTWGLLQAWLDAAPSTEDHRPAPSPGRVDQDKIMMPVASCIHRGSLVPAQAARRLGRLGGILVAGAAVYPGTQCRGLAAAGSLSFSATSAG